MKKKRRKITEFFERYLLLKNQSFMTKLFVFSSCLVIFPVLSVGIHFISALSIELEEEFRQSSRQVIEQVESHIEYYLQDFEITSLKIINSPEVNQFLQLDSLKNEQNEHIDRVVSQLFKNARIFKSRYFKYHGSFRYRELLLIHLEHKIFILLPT